ncbi:efflux RND transporter permease subunit, partial [Acinetobacter colistiniresistens]|uniref:efflux RND transporter permease subunit n=1 Tax=Acinetobacter colistiniresistens TaxID=280145 RepID=UPI001250B32B
GLRYISSNSAGNGQASINLNFEQGVDPDIAQVQVQNKLQSATGLWQLALRRLKADRIAVVSFIVVLFYFILLALSMTGVIAS